MTSPSHTGRSPRPAVPRQRGRRFKDKIMCGQNGGVLRRQAELTLDPAARRAAGALSNAPDR